jgi:hypothetical protein
MVTGAVVARVEVNGEAIFKDAGVFARSNMKK